VTWRDSPGSRRGSGQVPGAADSSPDPQNLAAQNNPIRATRSASPAIDLPSRSADRRALIWSGLSHRPRPYRKGSPRQDGVPGPHIYAGHAVPITLYAADRSSVAVGRAFLLLRILLGLSWTAGAGEGSGSRGALPEVGPRGQAVLDQLLARVTELEFCEHGCGDFAFWIATRPGRLLCEFCYEAAQVLSGDIRCAACRRPAGNPGTDTVVVARVAPWLGAHFYLCAWCAETHLRRTGQLG